MQILKTNALPTVSNYLLEYYRFSTFKDIKAMNTIPSDVETK